MTNKRVRAGIGALGLAALTLTACSGDPDDGQARTGAHSNQSAASTVAPEGAATSSDGSPTGPGASVSEQPASNGPAQSVDLSTVLPKAKDFPPSWTGVAAPRTDAGDERAARTLRRCTKAPDHENEVRETRPSRVFAIEPATVRATARSYDSQEAAYQYAAVLRGDESPTCLRASIAHDITAHRTGSEAITVHSVSVSVTVGTGGGLRNQQGAVYATADVTTGGVRTVLYITDIYLIGPRVTVKLTFTRDGEQFENNLLQRVTRVVAARAEKAD